MVVSAVLVFCAVIAVTVIKTRHVAFALGLFIPIDVVGSIDPMLFDALRYVLALTVVVRCPAEGRSRLTGPAALVTFALLLHYLVATTKWVGGLESAASIKGAVGLISVTLGALLARSTLLALDIARGFAVGALFSAADIISQVVGLPYLGTPTDWDVRYSGLSFSSTNTAPYLAIALILVAGPVLWGYSKAGTAALPPVIARIVACGTLGLGLVLSGGRGGLAGLLFAAVILMIFLARRRVGILTLMLIVIPLVLFAIWDRILPYFVRENSTGGLTTGRVALSIEAWSAFMEGSFFGLPFGEQTYFRPHTPMILFALQTGIVGLVVAIAVTAILLHIALRSAFLDASSVSIGMASGVMFTTALLEPTGFYIGLGKVTLMMLAVQCFARSVQDLGRPWGPVRSTNTLESAPS